MPSSETQRNMLKPKIARDAINAMLRPLLSWQPLPDPPAHEGFSIIVGTPWHLLELLPVNLMFLARTDLSACHAIHVVFDRRHQPEHDNVVAEARKRFSDLPLQFHHLPALPGRIAETADVANIYHAMTSVTALEAVQTPWAILHDFDLYPLRPDYFTTLWHEMQTRELKFAGLERTHFDGLTDEDNVIGTWCLGMNAAWLRQHHKPIDVFPRVRKVRDRYRTLDPFTHLELHTPERALSEQLSPNDCCHIRNLCDTYLNYCNDRPAYLAWKLHAMWYLQALAHEETASLTALADAMEKAGDMKLSYNGRTHDYSGIDPTCANVLETQITQLETFCFSQMRPEVDRYINATRRFMEQA